MDIVDQVLLDVLENTAGLDRQGLTCFRSHWTEHFLFVSMIGIRLIGSNEEQAIAVIQFLLKAISALR